jgi:hypothetical protein
VPVRGDWNTQVAAPRKPATRFAGLRFDRNELSGAFGDIGTDFPLIVGLILAAHLDPASVLIVFGCMQILTGLLYRMPMPAQPLKAMAVLVISQKLTGSVLYGAGLAIGIVMLFLSATGLIDGLARVTPKVVVRGIQFGLGLQLAALALKDYLPAEGNRGYYLGGVAFLLILALAGNRRIPPGPFAIVLGLVYAIVFRVAPSELAKGIGMRLPHLHVPTLPDIWTGFLLLALPQIPLSLGNSILATKQISEDLFPERPVTVRKIGFTYAAMNLLNPFLSGIPTCHGSGGMAGHYAFGGRTGGSVVLYGSLYLTLGLFLSGSFGQAILLFPQPVLGVILLFEAVALMALIRDEADSKSGLMLVILVGLLAANVPYGYVVALLAGTAIAYTAKRRLTGLTK